MTSRAKPIPNGYHTVTPYLTVEGADKLIDRNSGGWNRPGRSPLETYE